MRLTCGPSLLATGDDDAETMHAVLFSRPLPRRLASAGEAIYRDINRAKLQPTQRAWDFLSWALGALIADQAKLRAGSPDGWTREFDISVAVTDPDFWGSQLAPLGSALQFLTTDRWTLRALPGGFTAAPLVRPLVTPHTAIALLSGGLDSLIGGFDLAARGQCPLFVSRTVLGDAAKQVAFAERLAGAGNHLQLNPNVWTPGKNEPSQRARSLIFLALGVLVATTLQRYQDGEIVPLYVSENGFIALNPPLTDLRVGSLSTRTAHPEFLWGIQQVLDAAGLRVQIVNPYAWKTKGEMLAECSAQDALTQLASHATSCGRFLRFKHTHCGRCVPCQVRRAAFLHWGKGDTTRYVYPELGQPTPACAQFDDVRAVGMAIEAVRLDGIDAWISASLASPQLIASRALARDVLARGLNELRALHESLGVR